MLKYLHSDADGVEYYYDTNSGQLIVRDSRMTDEPVREAKVSWSVLKSALKDAIGHD